MRKCTSEFETVHCLEFLNYRPFSVAYLQVILLESRDYFATIMEYCAVSTREYEYTSKKKKKKKG